MLHDPMHTFFKLPRPVHRPLQSTSGFLPKLYVPLFSSGDCIEHPFIDTEFPLDPSVVSLLIRTPKVRGNVIVQEPSYLTLYM